MKLLSVKQARAIWLFPAADINPTGKYLYPLLGEMIKRYKFANIPNISEAIKNNQGLLFGTGVFSHGNLGEITVELGIYNDGLVGDTKSSTSASEAFLEDLLQWTSKEYGLNYPKNIKKRYMTELYVETGKALGSLNAKLERIAKAISLKSEDDNKSPYQLGGILFAAEQKTAFVPPLFKFERAEKSPFSDNRYYSSAGLRSEDHIEILEQLEDVLTK